MIMRRLMFRRQCARNSFLAVLALWGLFAFDAAHLAHHLNDDEAPFTHDVGSHAWWDGVLFHTGTIAEAVFVVRMPARPLIAGLDVDRPMRIDGIPLLVPDSRAPPSV